MVRMKKKCINLIIVTLAIVGGLAINLLRFLPLGRSQRPEFEVFDVRTFSDLESSTIIHYQIKNVGKVVALDLLTSVSAPGGNETPPAFFPSLKPGESASVNRNIPLGDYSELIVGVFCRGLEKSEYFTVEPDVKPEPPQNPDFVVYGLKLTNFTEGNQTGWRADFWIMNIGGSEAHDVIVSVDMRAVTTIGLLSPMEAKELVLVLEMITWQGLDVNISCREGVEQTYYLIEYG